MSTTQLGGTTPPGLFDDQSEACIFDPDSYITDAQHQLYPFSSIVHRIRDINNLNLLLQSKSKQSVVLVLIFPNQTLDEVIIFINDNVYRQQSIHSFYLFFTNGRQQEITLRSLFTPLLIECNSITNHIYSEIRAALSTACDLNCKFCYRRAREEQTLGNNSLVFIYEQQRRDRLKRQTIYNNCQMAEIDREQI